jgi:hypothetical protein
MLSKRRRSKKKEILGERETLYMIRYFHLK